MMFESFTNEQIFALGITTGSTLGVFMGIWMVRNERERCKEATK